MSNSIPIYKFGRIIGYTTVDEADYARFSKYRWYENVGYVLRYERDGSKTVSIRLHREIMSCPTGLHVDHINHDRRDNRRENLRIVTHAQNHQNRSYNPFRGAVLDKKKWVAQCKLNGKHYRVGRYETREEAAAAAAKLREQLLPYSTN